MFTVQTPSLTQRDVQRTYPSPRSPNSFLAIELSPDETWAPLNICKTFINYVSKRGRCDLATYGDSWIFVRLSARNNRANCLPGGGSP